jgi:hypothetical protein
MPTYRNIKSCKPTHKPTLRKTKRAIFCPRTYDDNATIKLNLADIKNFKY